MKLFKFTYLFFFFSLSFIYGQNKEKSVIDSLFKELDKARIPFEKDKFGETIKITSGILQKAKEINSLRIQAHCYNVLGNSYFEINDSLSFDYLFKARDAFIKINDSLVLTSILSNIATNYIEKGNNLQAEKYIRQALKITKNKKDQQRYRIYPLFNLADLLINKGDYRQGIFHVFEVLDICNSSDYDNSRGIIGDSYELLSYAYYKLGNKDKSEFYFKKCEAFSKKHKYLTVLIFLYDRRQNLYKADGEFEKAYNLLDKYTKASDSLNKIEEFEVVKKIEANTSLDKSKEQLALAKEEHAIQKAIINKGIFFTFLLVFLILSLIICLYFIYLKNKTYKLAKENAEELSKVKSDFYSEISHELRTPLYAVIELSRLLLKENFNNEHKEYLESLNFSGNHLLSLINNVLELNKVESGKIKLQIINFSLKTLINNITKSLEYALRDSNNKIHVNYDYEIPKYLEGDSLKLSQLLINFISNAIKFTHNGNIYITTKLINITDTNVNIYFEIKDDGIGISKNKQSKIFEEFYQEYDKNKNSYNGTGLGLPIAKRILKSMGSEIFIESKVNEGSAFSFEIKFSYNKKTSLNIGNTDSIIQDLKGLNFLIVDDNKINQLVTKKILDQFDIKSKVVNSGNEALSLFKIEQFDCILMDLHMPGLDGYQTTEIIRVSDENIPVIALTAASTEEVERKIYRYKLNAYVTKPFVASDFVQTIHKHVIKQ